MKNCASWIAIVVVLVLFAALPCLLGCANPPEPKERGCERPRVLAFTASWCGPCQRNKSVLVQLESWGVDVQVVDIDAHPELAAKYNVTSVPTYFIYICGRNVQRTQDVRVVVAAMKPLFRR